MLESTSLLESEIACYLPERIRALLAGLEPELLERVVELRLRVNQPLLLVLPERDFMVTEDGALSSGASGAYRCRPEDVARTARAIGKNSFYALEDELRLGYITIEGGHRIGLAGQAILENGRLKAVKNIGSLNIRVARQVKRCADEVMPFIYGADGRVQNTLVIAPPRCGKTTLLRDIARNLSCGFGAFGGVQVGVVDERSEIAACKSGVATADLGWRADVLDGCPKADGILMLIRTMAPAVIVTDELGRQEDADALCEALNAGVRVIASAHGASVKEAMARPGIGALLAARYFGRYIVLTDRPRVGAVKEILSAEDGQHLCRGERGR